MERQLAEFQQAALIQRSRSQDPSGSSDLAGFGDGQRADAPSVYPAVTDSSFRASTRTGAKEQLSVKFGGRTVESTNMSRPLTYSPDSRTRADSSAPSQSSTSHGGQFHARGPDLDYACRGSRGQNSEQDPASSPVDAMGTAVHGGNFRIGPTDQYYGQSSVVSLMKEVSEHHSDRQPDFVEDGPRQARAMNYVTSCPTHSEGDLASLMLQPRFSLPPRSIADKLLNLYFQSCHIFYPWIHSTSFRKEVDRLWLGQEQHPVSDPYFPDIGLGGRNCQPTVFFCALNAVFALGCEISDLPSDEKAASALVYAERMKDLLQIPILDSGSLAHVQALLLAGHHLLCTQYPTQCWNVIGLACRMALGLGLHSENRTETGITLETEIKRRVWHGCVQMDV